MDQRSSTSRSVAAEGLISLTCLLVIAMMFAIIIAVALGKLSANLLLISSAVAGITIFLMFMLTKKTASES